MPTEKPESYDAAARQFHWWTFAAVAIQFVLGIAMSIRGGWLDIWDTITNNLYSTHKLLGIIVFLLVAARLWRRLSRGTPPDEPTLEPAQKLVSRFVHRLLYALLLIVPVVGFFGVQLFPALDLFGLASLPAIVAPDKAMSAWVLWLHAILAFTLLFFIAMHVGAALYHYFIRRDGVLARMIPRLAGQNRR